MISSAREVALNILEDVLEKGAYSNISISKNLSNIKKEDESLIREIVYGVLENRGYIDYIIKMFSKTKFRKISPVIKNILRIGIYQILFMDKIPDSAAVNEAVKLAKKYSHKGTYGFVNGLLRNVIRNQNNITLPNKKSNKKEYLETKYSHPRWLIDRWIGEFKERFTEELLIANNSKPYLNIRVNTLKTTRDNLIKSLGEEGLEVEPTEYSKDGIIVKNPIRITDSKEFKNGKFQIQDESSMLVAQIMDPKPESFVIDVASAPGGKATHIAQMMENKGLIIARDIYNHKLKLIDENARRLGIDIIKTEKFDALQVDEKLIGKADYCLVDAPCSGLGLIRRKPEIRWNKKEEDINEISKIQYDILLKASKYVKKGGILVYSTCTIGKDENINIIERFLKDNKNFILKPFDELLPKKQLLDHASRGYIELYPNIHGTDGFFISKLMKI